FKRYRGAFIVTALFALALSLSCLFAMRSSVVLWLTQRSSNWLACQLEVEYLRYVDALSDLYVQELKQTPDNVRLRFDIFESRIRTISVGEDGAELRSMPQYRALLPLLEKAEESSAALMPKLDPSNPQQNLAAMRDLAALARPIHDWSMDALLHNRALE